MSTPLSAKAKTALKRLITAALDERNPSKRLVRAVNRYLTLTEHRDRLREKAK